MLLLKPCHEALKPWMLGLVEAELVAFAREVKVINKLSAQSLERFV